MKKLSILVVIILALAINSYAQETDAEKMMLYETKKKSGTTAVVLSCLLTSTGHAYAGNWGRGLAFTAGRVGCAVLAITLGIEEKTETHEDYYFSYTEKTTEITPIYYIGIIGAATIAIWEMVDASKEVSKYNTRLYEQITGKKSPIGLNFVPMKNGNGKYSPGIAFSYNF